MEREADQVEGEGEGEEEEEGEGLEADDDGSKQPRTSYRFFVLGTLRAWTGLRYRAIACIAVQSCR